MVKNRRKSLAQVLPENTLTLFFSGKAPYKVGDEKYPFSVDRNFYYLTGLDKENMILLIVKFKGSYEEYLFIDRYDELQAKWVGGKMLPEEAKVISEINHIAWNDELYNTIDLFLNNYFAHLEHKTVYFDFSCQEYPQNPSEAIEFANALKQRYPDVELYNVCGIMARKRMIKEDIEIKQLRKAIDITKEGIENMMMHAYPGMMEYELEAYFDFTLKKHHADHSFTTIAAGGKNATILHYTDNHKKIKDRSLVLCDLGATYGYMNADITRTFPINGTFTKRQKEVYEVVLNTNKMIIKEAKCGMTLRSLNQLVLDYYQHELAYLGLLKKGKTVQDYYWHSVSHMIGLETHDCSILDERLKAGNVFSDEPGIYIEDEHIGIRIEDDLLLSDQGCINLSEKIIKEVDEIESFMSQNHQEPY